MTRNTSADKPKVSKPKPKRRPPLTDVERLKRFKDMAKETEADADSDTFERAFAKVVKPPKPKD